MSVHLQASQSSHTNQCRSLKPSAAGTWAVDFGTRLLGSIHFTFSWKWILRYVCVTILGKQWWQQCISGKQAVAGSVMVWEKLDPVLYVRGTLSCTTSLSIKNHSKSFHDKSSTKTVASFSRTMYLATLHELYKKGFRSMKKTSLYDLDH